MMGMAWSAVFAKDLIVRVQGVSAGRMAKTKCDFASLGAEDWQRHLERLLTGLPGSRSGKGRETRSGRKLATTRSASA